MKRFRTLIMAGLGVALLSIPVMAQEGERSREDLRERMRELRQELRELERELGQNRARQFAMPNVMTFMSNRARLGVMLRTEANEETDVVGAVLSSVMEDSPAEAAGLQAGDIIVSVDGKRLVEGETRRRSDESAPALRLINFIGEYEVGDDVTIEYQRDGQTFSTIATLDETDNVFSFDFDTGDGEFYWNPQVAIPPAGLEAARGMIAVFGGPWSDIELVSVDESLGRYFGTSEGLLVVKAPDDASLQLQSGDVILSIDGREPRSPSRAMRILRSYEAGEGIDIDIMRERQRMTISATVPERENRLRRREFRRF